MYRSRSFYQCELCTLSKHIPPVSLFFAPLISSSSLVLCSIFLYCTIFDMVTSLPLFLLIYSACAAKSTLDLIHEEQRSRIRDAAVSYPTSHSLSLSLSRSLSLSFSLLLL